MASSQSSAYIIRKAHHIKVIYGAKLKFPGLEQ